MWDGTWADVCRPCLVHVRERRRIHRCTMCGDSAGVAPVELASGQCAFLCGPCRGHLANRQSDLSYAIEVASAEELGGAAGHDPTSSHGVTRPSDDSSSDPRRGRAGSPPPYEAAEDVCVNARGFGRTGGDKEG